MLCSLSIKWLKVKCGLFRPFLWTKTCTAAALKTHQYGDARGPECARDFFVKKSGFEAVLSESRAAARRLPKNSRLCSSSR